MVISGNTLYGTASAGGTNGNGVVFAVNTNGTGFAVLHSFIGYPNEGSVPIAGLLLSGNTLYGTTQGGGSAGVGTVFAINTDGTGFANLYSFANGSDGALPRASLILSGNTLYGTTSQGGIVIGGTVFSLSFPPQLTITPSGANVILTWPVDYAGFNYAGYAVQDTTNLLSPTAWSVPDPTSPLIVNGQYQITKPMMGPQRSYRLVK